MGERTIGTAVTTHDDGSESVLLVNKITLENDPPLMSISYALDLGWPESVFVESRAIAEQLIELIRAAADEIWPAKDTLKKEQ
jgi:hypothetical protein